MTKRYFTQCFPAVNAIIEKDGKFLIVEQRKPAFKGKWSFPGGWIEVENDDPIKAIIREVKEETGLDFIPDGIVGIISAENWQYKKEQGFVAHSIKIIFTGKYSGKVDPKFKHEIGKTKWVSAKEAKSVDWRTPSDIEIINAFNSGEKYPISIIHHYIQK